MIENAYYSQEVHGPYQIQGIGDLPLKEGGTLRGCKLAFATHGKPNAARDNAILIPTWYSGTSKIWELVYIGPDHALDPTRYSIVSVNQIGGGLSSLPHNTPGPQGMASFPHVRISDDVAAGFPLHRNLERDAAQRSRLGRWQLRGQQRGQRRAEASGEALDRDDAASS